MMVNSGTKFSSSDASGRIKSVRVPGEFGKDAGPDAVARIGAAIKILRKQRHAFGMEEEIGMQNCELLRGDRLVAGPPHVLVGGGITNRELVLSAAAGEHAGIGAERAIGREHGFAGSQRMLIEPGRAK